MSDLPWSERVPMLSINPEAASREDVARLAADLMASKARLREAEEALSAEKTNRVNNYADARRVAEWIGSEDREPANIAFTEGPERFIGYSVEALVYDLISPRQEKGDCAEHKDRTNEELRLLKQLADEVGGMDRAILPDSVIEKLDALRSQPGGGKA